MRPPHAPAPPPGPAQAERPFAVYAGMLTAAQAIFCVQDAVAKEIGAQIGVLQYAAVRSVFVLGLLGLGALLTPRFRGRLRRPRPALLRSLFQVAAVLLHFTALTQMPIAVAATGFYTFPILTTLIGAAVSGQPLPLRVWLAAPLGFLGAAVILGPQQAEVDWAILLPLGAAACYAVSVVITHHACAGEDTLALLRLQTLAFLAAGTLGLAGSASGLLPASAGWTPMTGADWGVLAAISALNLAMAFLLLYVYQHASPARLGPFSYSYLVFAAAMDWAAWGTPPTPATLLGAGLTALAGVLVLTARPSAPARERTP